MSIEGQNLEGGREEEIEKLIEQLIWDEEMEPDDVFSDIATFAELYEENEDAAAYLEEVAEKIGITFEEMLEYAKKIKK